MPDDHDYRRQMDDKIIGFLAAHEVWMTGDTTWKAETKLAVSHLHDCVESMKAERDQILGAIKLVTWVKGLGVGAGVMAIIAAVLKAIK